MLDGRIAAPALRHGMGVEFLNPDGSTSAEVPGGRPSALLLRPDGAVFAVGSHQYVRDTYQGALPDQPWLLARDVPGRKPQRATGT